MPSFDTKLDPNIESVGNAVDTTAKEIGTRFDFKGTSAAVEFKKKEKDARKRRAKSNGEFDPGSG